MKKLFYMCLLFCLTLGGKLYGQQSVWDGVSSDKSWYDESQQNYYLMTAAQLKGLADLTNIDKLTFENKTIYLDCDIDLGGFLWTPIADYVSPNDTPEFKGTFNGQNHSITNIYVSSETNPYNNSIAGVRSYYTVGFFGSTSSAVIKNLIIKGNVVTKENQYCGTIGFLVGSASNTNFELIQSDVNMEIGYNISTDLEIGGVVGRGSGSVFNKIKVTGTINTLKGQGGIASSQIGKCGGVCGSASSVNECEVDMTIHINTQGSGSTQYIGGCCGSATVTDAIFTGILEVHDSWQRNMGVMVGGISARGSLLNTISAPSTFYAESNPNWCADIVAPKTVNSVSNARYLNGITSNSGNNGTSISDDELKSGVSLDGFSSDIWTFTAGGYPRLKAFIKDKYKLTYMVDGEIWETYEYKYGESIRVIVSEPWRDGYTFSGWSEIPVKMPAEDVVVTGGFSANKYKLTYIVDNETYKTYEVEYGSDITAEEAPTKEGYTFSGWSMIPTTMPAHDVTITGTFTEVNISTHDYVDLGLPSGLLWATTNVGASHPEEYGSYFAWGETSPKSKYSWATYKYANGSETTLTKYCNDSSYGNIDNKDVLDEQDDAATINWGEPWRTPTLSETQELINNCTWTQTSKNGVNGYTVTGSNGNFIFLPAGGVMQYNGKYFTERSVVMSANLFTYCTSASVLNCQDGTPNYWYGWDRCWGYPVRPVRDAEANSIHESSISDDSGEIMGIYNIQGHKLEGLINGINIIKYKNGMSKRVFVK